MKTNAVQEHLATSTPSPHSQHLRRVLEHGMQRTATKLDPKLSFHYGYSPPVIGDNWPIAIVVTAEEK